MHKLSWTGHTSENCIFILLVNIVQVITVRVLKDGERMEDMASQNAMQRVYFCRESVVFFVFGSL